MDIVIEKLSNLESIWRITSQEIVEIIEKSDLEDEEEFDIFKYKVNETQRITGLIDDLIMEANDEKVVIQEKIKSLLIKNEEEIKEIGIPITLQTLNLNCNLPKQLKVVEELWNDLQVIKEQILMEKERLYKESMEMYREEVEYGFNGNSEPLPSWIHELFDPQTSNISCEDSSFTTAAISHLDAAINQLDPFYPSLSGSLARIEEAHLILKGRLEMFKAEYEAIWKDIEVLFLKLHPFATEEIKTVENESKLIIDIIKTESSVTAPRSSLRKVLNEWKRVEKERSESISGSILLIGRLWNLLETCSSERFHLDPTTLSLENMRILSEERNRLINFQQQKFKELYDAQVIELEKLMTALRWKESKKREILTNCQSYTADGLQFLSCQLAALQPKLELSLSLNSSITARYALITKMREFEKSASDPARLFRSSFQLLQEEKFRKTALPSLLNLESQIKTQLSEYKLKFGEDFHFYLEDDSDECACSCYLALLEEEIASRFMSSGIFGFDQSKQRKERQNSTNSTPSSTPRYTTTPLSSSNTNRKVPSNVIPQRRKLEK